MVSEILYSTQTDKHPVTFLYKDKSIDDNIGLTAATRVHMWVRNIDKPRTVESDRERESESVCVRERKKERVRERERRMQGHIWPKFVSI